MVVIICNETNIISKNVAINCTISWRVLTVCYKNITLLTRKSKCTYMWAHMNSLGVNCTHPRMAIVIFRHWFRVISPKRIFGHLGCEDLISTTVQDKMAVGCQRDIPWFAYKQGRYHSSPSKHHSSLFCLNNHRLYSRGIRFRLNSSVSALYRIVYTTTSIFSLYFLLYYMIG